MPLGLQNGAQMFQGSMDSVCAGLDFMFFYLDDVLVTIQDKTRHLLHLQKLFSWLVKAGLVINPSKCQFGVSQLNFLGHRVDKHGVTPLPPKVETIRNFPRLKMIHQLWEFNGMINFYNRFVPGAAHIMLPLDEVTAGYEDVKKSTKMV